MHAITNQSGELYFLDAPGGTSKTLLILFILAAIRSRKIIALAIASSEIAATLLNDGRTELQLNRKKETTTFLFSFCIYCYGEGTFSFHFNRMQNVKRIYYITVDSVYVYILNSKLKIHHVRVYIICIVFIKIHGFRISSATNRYHPMLSLHPSFKSKART